jgi:uncharacterized Zn-finger protein
MKIRHQCNYNYNSVAFGARKSIAAPTTQRHALSSRVWSIQSSSESPTSRRSRLTLSAHLVLGLPTGRLPCKLPTNTLHTVLSSVIRATCPAQSSLRLFIALNISKYKNYVFYWSDLNSFYRETSKHIETFFLSISSWSVFKVSLLMK